MPVKTFNTHLDCGFLGELPATVGYFVTNEDSSTNTDFDIDVENASVQLTSAFTGTNTYDVDLEDLAEWQKDIIWQLCLSDHDPGYDR